MERTVVQCSLALCGPAELVVSETVGLADRFKRSGRNKIRDLYSVCIDFYLFTPFTTDMS